MFNYSTQHNFFQQYLTFYHFSGYHKKKKKKIRVLGKNINMKNTKLKVGEMSHFLSPALLLGARRNSPFSQ